eukprot:2649311-Rhodomonas_salina.1
MGADLDAACQTGGTPCLGGLLGPGVHNCEVEDQRGGRGQASPSSQLRLSRARIPRQRPSELLARWSSDGQLQIAIRLCGWKIGDGDGCCGSDGSVELEGDAASSA